MALNPLHSPTAASCRSSQNKGHLEEYGPLRGRLPFAPQLALKRRALGSALGPFFSPSSLWKDYTSCRRLERAGFVEFTHCLNSPTSFAHCGFMPNSCDSFRQLWFAAVCELGLGGVTQSLCWRFFTKQQRRLDSKRQISLVSKVLNSSQELPEPQENSVQLKKKKIQFSADCFNLAST